MTRPIVLVGLCALAYAFATLAMKIAAHAPGVTPMLAIAVTLALAVLAELILMRQFPIAMVYLGILAAETVLVLVFAALIGEAMSLKQLAGAALVLCGAALVTV